MEKQKKFYLRPSLSKYNKNHNYKIVIVGAGGTGSWLSQYLSLLSQTLSMLNHPPIDLILIDDDIVEETNCGRQNFFLKEIGLNKTDALAIRLSRQYGVNISSIPLKINQVELDQSNNNEIDLICICVDNDSARKFIYDNYPNTDILDCGNDKDFGQIIFTDYERNLESYEELFGFDLNNIESNYSCRLIDKLEEQSLFINNEIAVKAAEFIKEYIYSETISYSQLFLNQKTGRSIKSLKFSKKI